MVKEILLKFSKGGEVKAKVLEDEAPNVAKVLLASLPVEFDVIHAKWAGEELMSDFFPTDLEVPLGENETNNPKPGDMALMSRQEIRNLTAWDGKTTLPQPDSVPMCIFYGKARPRKSLDETGRVNVVARVEDTDALYKIGFRIRVHGIEKLSISLVE